MEEVAVRRSFEAHWCAFCDRPAQEWPTSVFKTWFGESAGKNLNCRPPSSASMRRPAFAAELGSPRHYGRRGWPTGMRCMPRVGNRRGEPRAAARRLVGPSNEIIRRAAGCRPRRTISRRCRGWFRRSAACADDLFQDRRPRYTFRQLRGRSKAHEFAYCRRPATSPEPGNRPLPSAIRSTFFPARPASARPI